MAMGTERSKPLHNFTLPCELRWGNQRHLRCMKVNSNGQDSPIQRFAAHRNSSDHHNHHLIQQRRTTRDGDRERDGGPSSGLLHGSRKVGPAQPPGSNGRRRFSDEDEDEDGIAAMREKVMFDLQTAADKMKDAIFKDGLEEGEVANAPPHPPPPAAASLLPPQISAEGEASRPWNLRTRRAACTTPVSGFGTGRNGGTTTAGGGIDAAGAKGLGVDVPRPMVFPQMRASAAAAAAAASDKSPRLRSGGNGASTSGEKKERPKFSLALSKREIEEDFVGMVGRRPPRRPKKRAKNVQKQLDLLFPGVFLTEITPDMYKVTEPAP